MVTDLRAGQAKYAVSKEVLGGVGMPILRYLRGAFAC